MDGSLSVVVQDEVAGCPAAGLRMQVYWVEPNGDVLLKAASTDTNGTTATPLVSGTRLSAGVYRLVLHIGDYLQQTNWEVTRSVNVLPIVFVIDHASVGRQVRVSVCPSRYAVACA